MRFPTTKKALMADKEQIELELESNIQIPAPLDPHIASVTIRTGANNASDYFDLLLSASFGSEYVILESGQDRIEVKVRVLKAEVKFNSVNCDLHLLSDDRDESWRGSEKEQANSTSNRDVSASIESTAGAKKVQLGGNIEAGAGKSRITQKSQEFDRDLLPWRVVSSDTVQVGYLEDFSRPLHGRIIDENIAVRVTPKSIGRKVGLLVRIRVRERWIEITNPKPLKVTERLRKFLVEILGKGDAEKRRQHLFSRLLAHLIAKELQDPDNTRDATMAASAIVFSPRKEKFQGVPIPRPRSEVRIDPTSIEKFISASVGSEEEILREIGVDFDDSDDVISGKFARIWQNPRNRKLSYFAIDLNKLEGAYSSSFSRKVKIQKIGDVGRRKVRLKVTVTNVPCPPRDAPDIVKRFSPNWMGEEMAVYYGVLTKGEEAYEIAKLLGYKLSYATLRSKIRKNSLMTGYGNLVSFYHLVREVAGEDGIQSLEGSSLVFDVFSVK